MRRTTLAGLVALMTSYAPALAECFGRGPLPESDFELSVSYLTDFADETECEMMGAHKMICTINMGSAIDIFEFGIDNVVPSSLCSWIRVPNQNPKFKWRSIFGQRSIR